MKPDIYASGILRGSNHVRGRFADTFAFVGYDYKRIEFAARNHAGNYAVRILNDPERSDPAFNLLAYNPDIHV